MNNFVQGIYCFLNFLVRYVFTDVSNSWSEHDWFWTSIFWFTTKDFNKSLYFLLLKIKLY